MIKKKMKKIFNKIKKNNKKKLIFKKLNFD